LLRALPWGCLIGEGERNGGSLHKERKAKIQQGSIIVPGILEIRGNIPIKRRIGRPPWVGPPRGRTCGEKNPPGQALGNGVLPANRTRASTIT